MQGGEESGGETEERIKGREKESGAVREKMVYASEYPAAAWNRWPMESSILSSAFASEPT